MELSQEWLSGVISKALGYERLKSWQLSAIMSMVSGQDVFAIAPTGAGKSTVMLGAVIADKARGKESIAITIVPTKSLANDQARAVNDLNLPGIKALALHEDTLEVANCERPRRDLFREIRDGAYSHIFLGPEMVMSAGFDQVLKDSKFYERFRYFAVDEVHLTLEWKVFRENFADIHRLRNRFKVAVAWLALSATIEPKQEFRALTTSLGFDLAPGKTNIIHLPVDRPGISYSPRFLKYGASDEQREFPDVSFLVPRSLVRIEDIPPTVVFSGTIKQVTRIAKYLTRLLPAGIDPATRREAIVPFNGTLSALQNDKAITDLRAGKTRILVSTAAGALGIDVKNVERVVIIAEKDTNYRMLCQKMGRIRGSGRAIVYFQSWMNIARTGSTDTARRSEVESVLVDFANATMDRCPRAINIDYWGDSYASNIDGEQPIVPPSECCNKHNPGLDQDDLLEVGERVKISKNKKTAQNPQLRSDGMHRVPDKLIMQPIARDLIHDWRREQLEDMIGYEHYLPFSAVISDNLVNTLVEKLHICSTLDRFRQLMRDWNRLDELGNQLYDLVKYIWEVYESEEGSNAIEDIKSQRTAAQETETLPADTGSGHVIDMTNTGTPLARASSVRRAPARPTKNQGTQNKGKRKSQK